MHASVGVLLVIVVACGPARPAPGDPEVVARSLKKWRPTDRHALTDLLGSEVDEDKIQRQLGRERRVEGRWTVFPSRGVRLEIADGIVVALELATVASGDVTVYRGKAPHHLPLTGIVACKCLPKFSRSIAGLSIGPGGQLPWAVRYSAATNRIQDVKRDRTTRERDGRLHAEREQHERQARDARAAELAATRARLGIPEHVEGDYFGGLLGRRGDDPVILYWLTALPRVSFEIEGNVVERIVIGGDFGRRLPLGLHNPMNQRELLERLPDLIVAPHRADLRIASAPWGSVEIQTSVKPQTSVTQIRQVVLHRMSRTTLLARRETEKREDERRREVAVDAWIAEHKPASRPDPIDLLKFLLGRNIDEPGVHYWGIRRGIGIVGPSTADGRRLLPGTFTIEHGQIRRFTPSGSILGIEPGAPLVRQPILRKPHVTAPFPGDRLVIHVELAANMVAELDFQGGKLTRSQVFSGDVRKLGEETRELGAREIAAREASDLRAGKTFDGNVRCQGEPGKLTCTDGTVTKKGQVDKSLQLDGYGSVTWVRDGATFTFTGNFKHDVLSGDGTIEIITGNGRSLRYKGAIVSFEPHGHGSLSLQSPGTTETFVGPFDRGIPHGTGTYSRTDRKGTITWSGGMTHGVSSGKGTLRSSGGAVRSNVSGSEVSITFRPPLPKPAAGVTP